MLLFYIKYKGLYISKDMLYLQGDLIMEMYYENNISKKIQEIGKMKFKFVFKRNTKKAVVFYLTNIYVNAICSAFSLAAFIWGITK